MLTKTPWEIMAEALYKAMKGHGIKERVINEILAACSRDDIPEIKKAYEQGIHEEFKISIEENIIPV